MIINADDIRKLTCEFRKANEETRCYRPFKNHFRYQNNIKQIFLPVTAFCAGQRPQMRYTSDHSAAITADTVFLDTFSMVTILR